MLRDHGLEKLILHNAVCVSCGGGGTPGLGSSAELQIALQGPFKQL